MLSVPGQPDRELVPTRGTSFDLAGLSGFSIDFKRDPAGKVVEAALHQLDTTIVLKRK